MDLAEALLDRLGGGGQGRPNALGTLFHEMDKNKEGGAEGPATSYIQTREGLIIQFAVPGCTAEDIDVLGYFHEPTNSMALEVTAHFPDPFDTETQPVYVEKDDIHRGKAHGRLILNNVDTREATSKVENGLLTILLPWLPDNFNNEENISPLVLAAEERLALLTEATDIHTTNG